VDWAAEARRALQAFEIRNREPAANNSVSRSSPAEQPWWPAHRRAPARNHLSGQVRHARHRSRRFGPLSRGRRPMSRAARGIPATRPPLTWVDFRICSRTILR
jgi:hypothetical protein